jgi:hypothetical protein
VGKAFSGGNANLRGLYPATVGHGRHQGTRLDFSTTDIGQQRLTGIRQEHSPGMAEEQWRSQRLLQASYLPADGGGGHPQRQSGFRD